MKKRILFVDADPLVLDEVRAMLASQADQWDMVFLNRGDEALAALAAQRHDAIVTDLQLPDQSGVQLLNQVMERHPQMQRLILADVDDQEAMFKCVGTAHQFLLKPCEAHRLRAALDRAFDFEVWLPSEATQRLLGQMKQLPSPPHLYFQVIQELRSPTATLDNVGALIGRDPAMTAKLLQLVNSAAFGLEQEVVNPMEAVLYLGLDATQSLILLAHSFSYFDQIKDSTFAVGLLWRHSIRTGNFAQWIAKADKVPPPFAQEAFTAGLLHDIGKLAMAANLPQLFRESLLLARTSKLTAWEAELKVFGATHAEIGGCLLATWGLPSPIVEAVALHHHPAPFFTRNISPLTLVHVANSLEHADNNDPEAPAVDLEYLRAIDCEPRLAAWRQVCRARSCV